MLAVAEPVIPADLVKATALAKSLHVDTVSVYRMVSSGKIKPYRIGAGSRSMRFSVAEVLVTLRGE